MIKKPLFAAFLAIFALLAISGCGGNEQIQERGKYIYDEANRLPLESELSLASYLWRLDLKTGYEIILAFPKNMMEEDDLIKWFNNHGAGKKKLDNGTVVFVLPDDSVFVAIGSGNDKISVTSSKTYGEKIFENFGKDPVLTLLRFANQLGGKLDEAGQTEIGPTFFESIKESLLPILLWIAAIALLIFLIQQLDGFELSDLILPAAVFLALGLFLGLGAIGSSADIERYTTYGAITATNNDSYTFTRAHEICTGDGKTTTCTTYYTFHTMYTNDVKFLSYEFKQYGYKFSSEDNKSAWLHEIGEIDALSVYVKNGGLAGASGIQDNSGGKTIGDGVWIMSGRKK